MAIRPPYQSLERKPAIPVGWQERLDLCDTESEVVEITREFIAHLEPWEVAHLPLACRPRKLFTTSDVADYAFDIVRWERENECVGDLVPKMSAFFAHASVRLSEVILGIGMNDPEAARRDHA
jgi:hypothetical protein